MPHSSGPSLVELSRRLATGATSARRLVEDCLARIGDQAGEGARVFTAVDAEGARTAADAQDLLRKAGAAGSPYAGIPIAIKDLADITGQVTRAGSKALANAAPVSADAPVVARLRAAGFVLIGRTNMTEFAYSGLGLNPHYGTPLSPYDRGGKRVPGGSSSGSAVAVADGMAHGALGTDTGGSCRIPAAFCGVTGFKPTARRVPIDGIVPLAVSLDSAGPIARTVACCAVLDAVMAGEPIALPEPAALAGARFLVPGTLVFNDLDASIAAAFEKALSRLSTAGARIERKPFPVFDQVADLNRKGGIAAAEAYAWHRTLIAEKGATYDQRVRARILRGGDQSAADYMDLLARRRAMIADFAAAMTGYDALLMPTTAIPPPRLAEVENDDDYLRLNLLVLRNTMIINLVDGASISLPLNPPGALPASLMLSAPAMSDRRILALASAIEATLA